MVEIKIPDKLFFNIGEVSKILKVKPHVIRYWEKEFEFYLKPAKSASGHRLYKKKDIVKLQKLKSLLYGENFTIKGARKKLKNFAESFEYKLLQEIRIELQLLSEDIEK